MGITIINSLWLIVLGVLAAPNLVISKKPEAKEILDKLVPYQGWFGAVTAVWGVIQVIRFITNLDWFDFIPVLMITWLVMSLLSIGLGILLGIGVIKTFVKSEKLDELVAKLAPKQGKMGLIAIIVGAWALIARIFDIVV
ncbi:hypothetical protein JW921_11600 [Candidatus Fermentibacterales bacterium]|nr:hypothetical protein [Candidatus Fermentibacterales bacterium]